jgi:hypothetical protein
VQPVRPPAPVEELSDWSVQPIGAEEFLRLLGLPPPTGCPEEWYRARIAEIEAGLSAERKRIDPYRGRHGGGGGRPKNSPFNSW